MLQARTIFKLDLNLNIAFPYCNCYVYSLVGASPFLNRRMHKTQIGFLAALYSAFISYRVASEEPLARLLFDDLNHRLARVFL